MADPTNSLRDAKGAASGPDLDQLPYGISGSQVAYERGLLLHTRDRGAGRGLAINN